MTEPLTREEREGLRCWAAGNPDVPYRMAQFLARIVDDLERVESDRAGLRYTLRILLKAIEARQKLDAGFEGMGHNILVEDAGRMRYAKLRAKALLSDGDAAAEEIKR